MITYAYLDPILDMFGANYLAAKPCTIILLMGNCLASMIGAPYFILQYSGHVKKFVLINVVCILLMIILAFCLVPSIGSIGIAYASIAASVFQNIASVILVKRNTSIKPLIYI